MVETLAWYGPHPSAKQAEVLRVLATRHDWFPTSDVAQTLGISDRAARLRLVALERHNPFLALGSRDREHWILTAHGSSWLNHLTSSLAGVD